MNKMNKIVKTLGAHRRKRPGLPDGVDGIDAVEFSGELIIAETRRHSLCLL